MIVQLLLVSFAAQTQGLEVVHLSIDAKTKRAVLERLRYQSGAWSKKSIPLVEIEHAKFPGHTFIASNSRFSAFWSSQKGKNGVTVVFPSGMTSFVDIPEYIYELEFTPNSKKLIVHGRKSYYKPERTNRLITLSDSKVLSVERLDAWIGVANNEQLIGVDSSDKIHIWNGTKPATNRQLETRLGKLIVERKSTRLQPFGAFGDPGATLPTEGSAFVKSYVISSTLLTMFEMGMRNYGTPNGEKERLDGLNHISEDNIFEPKRGILWRIGRPTDWGYAGKYLTDTHFRFMSVTPVKMGKNKILKTYAPGIYDVNFRTSKVVKLAPLPAPLAKVMDDQYWTMVN